MKLLTRVKSKLLYDPESTGRSDTPLILLIVTLVLIGSVMVASASYAYAASRYGDPGYFIRKQAVFVILGILIMIVISKVPMRIF